MNYKLLFAVCLTGCGSLDVKPNVGTISNQNPRVVAQAVLRSTAITHEDWIKQIEALNHQQQNELGDAWGTNVILVDTAPALADPNKLSLNAVDILPIVSKRGKVYGYHTGRNSFVDIPVCLQGPEYQWNRTCSHEMCEMVVNEGVSSFPNRITHVIFGVPSKEICDSVSSASYGYPDESGSPILVDFTFPAWWGLGNTTFTLAGKPIYDYMRVTTAPGRVAAGGLIEKSNLITTH